MTACYAFHAGRKPLLISVPHDGRELPPQISERMTERGRAIPDTDWHVNRLYDFADELGASVISANYSRYVVDLNRSSDDAALYANQRATGLCPQQTFAGEDIYETGRGVTEAEQDQRTAQYWQPYHDKVAAVLSELKSDHGEVLLWDAHSIPASVPLLFEGRLPDLNVGTNDGASCSEAVATAVTSAAEKSAFTSVLNGRFKGGFITRNYGAPTAGVHAVQLELSQCCYMDEKSLRYDAGSAQALADTITKMLHAGMAALTRAAQ